MCGLSSGAVSPGPPRVLLADDEPQLLSVVVRVLEKNGYAVAAAATSDEAIRAFRAAPAEFTAAILDAAIEPNGAAEILETIVRERPDVRVIVTSGDAPGDSLRDLIVEHDGLFLRKPFSPRALLRLIEEAIAR